jgi:hypothetical protein
MDKRLLTYIFILVISLSGCTQAVSITPSIIPTSGIEGYVTEGPMCPGPVAIGDTRCQDQPYQATISILGADNQEVTRLQADPAGYFKITLAPGTYTLHPLSDKTLPRASDQNVVVTLNQFTQVTVVYDTGMR